ncbi:MAG: peroxiredoxin [Proteobacteria bacterium]|nr:peroxiredoxin [Pseudomonadota bacterium]
MDIAEGLAAPDFTLPDQNGEAVSLSDFEGKQVFVYFYPRDNTPGCTKQAVGFTELFDEFEKLNTQILGISPDGAKSHQKFINLYNIPYPLLSDPDKTVMSQYGAWGKKMMYGKEVTGTIRSTIWVDEQGIVVKHWKKVPKAADHPMKVLEQLKGSLKGRSA